MPAAGFFMMMLHILCSKHWVLICCLVLTFELVACFVSKIHLRIFFSASQNPICGWLVQYVDYEHFCVGGFTSNAGPFTSNAAIYLYHDSKLGFNMLILICYSPSMLQVYKITDVVKWQGLDGWMDGPSLICSELHCLMLSKLVNHWMNNWQMTWTQRGIF